MVSNFQVRTLIIVIEIPVFDEITIRGAAALWAVVPLVYPPAGRTMVVKARRKPVHFSLDGRCSSCYSLPASPLSASRHSTTNEPSVISL